MIKLLWTYRKYIGLALLLMGIITIYVTHRHFLIQKGRNIELAICNAGKLETINGNLQIQEKSNKVRRLPSDDAYINRLLEGSI